MPKINVIRRDVDKLIQACLFAADYCELYSGMAVVDITKKKYNNKAYGFRCLAEDLRNKYQHEIPKLKGKINGLEGFIRRGRGKTKGIGS